MWQGSTLIQLQVIVPQRHFLTVKILWYICTYLTLGRTHTHMPVGARTSKKQLTCLRSQREEPWRAVKCAKMLVGAQNNKNNICTSSTARGGLLINAAANLKLTNPQRFPSFLGSLKFYLCSAQRNPENVSHYHSVPLSVLLVEIRKDSQWACKSLKCTH